MPKLATKIPTPYNQSMNRKALPKPRKPSRQTLIFLASLIGGVMALALMGLLVFLLGKTQQPTHDFIYTTNYSTSYQYQVTDGTLESRNTLYSNTTPTTVWYRYHVSTDKSTRLTLEEVQQLTLTDAESDPDGFRFMSHVDRNEPSPPLLFTPERSNSRTNTYILSNGTSTKVLQLEGDPYSAFFVGWIVNNQPLALSN